MNYQASHHNSFSQNHPKTHSIGTVKAKAFDLGSPIKQTPQFVSKLQNVIIGGHNQSSKLSSSNSGVPASSSTAAGATQSSSSSHKPNGLLHNSGGFADNAIQTPASRGTRVNRLVESSNYQKQHSGSSAKNYGGGNVVFLTGDQIEMNGGVPSKYLD